MLIKAEYRGRYLINTPSLSPTAEISDLNTGHESDWSEEYCHGFMASCIDNKIKYTRIPLHSASKEYCVKIFYITFRLLLNVINVSSLHFVNIWKIWSEQIFNWPCNLISKLGKIC